MELACGKVRDIIPVRLKAPFIVRADAILRSSGGIS